MDNSLEIKEILTNLGYSLKDRGEQWSCAAIYRGGDSENSISINKKSGEFFDFVTNIGGSLESLIEKTLGTPITAELKERLKSNLIETKTYETDLEHVKTFDKKLLLKLDKDHSYWTEKRGISLKTIEKFQGGVTRTGRMQQRYTFPIFNERDELVGFTGRDLGNSSIKWRILGPKSTWIYPLINKNEIINSKSVILVESQGNLFRLMDNDINNVLVTFGTKISSSVIQFLLKTNVNKIYIAFDNDNKNSFAGNKAAIESKEKLLNYFDEGQIEIKLPDGFKDWGEATPEYIKEVWANANLRSI